MTEKSSGIGCIAQDKLREDLLQAYLDQLSELLLKEWLRTSLPESEVRTVARVRTLTVLSQLDTRRKNHVLSFLRETNLVSPKKGESVITFQKADLRGADLAGVEINLASLNFADLSDATAEKTSHPTRDGCDNSCVV